MPSIIINPEERQQWARYWRLIRDAREFAVWRHEEDGQKRENGQERPPRFVAVVADPVRLARLADRAAAVAELPTRWPLQVFAESWGWARVSVNSAAHAQRLAPGVAALVGEVKDGQDSDAQRVAAALLEAGHRAALTDSEGRRWLEVTPGPGGLTARTGEGRAFRLRAWSPDGVLLRDKIAVGAVVVGGLDSIEDTTGRPRKSRGDMLERVAGWGAVGLFQPAGGLVVSAAPARRGRAAPVAEVLDALPLFPLAEEAQPDALRFNPATVPPRNLSGTARRVLEAVAAGASLVRAGERWQLAGAGEAPRFVDPRTVARLRAEGLLVPG